MNDASSSRPVPTAGELAAHLRTAVGALVRGTRAADRLAPVPAAVLDLLDVRGPMTTADLAAGRHVRHQTMAATVKELADAGFVAAGPDPGDARKKILTLTAAGKAAIDADRRQRVAILAQALDETLNEDERLDLAHALDLIDRITQAAARISSPPGDGRNQAHHRSLVKRLHKAGGRRPSSVY
jgi:DNA-binding MarR family transcriptional regulator